MIKENDIAFILAQGSNILPIEWISYIVVGALTFVIGMWIRAFIDKPQDLEKRVINLESSLMLNKKDDDHERKDLTKDISKLTKDVEELRKDVREIIKEVIKK